MKYRFLFVLWIIIVGTSNSSLLLADDSKFSVALSYENYIYNNTPQDVIGINLEYYLSENISLNYNYNFSLEPHIQLLHSPIMTFLGWELIHPVLKELSNENEDEDSDPSWAIGAFLLSMAIPEGVNFHFPWRDQSNTGIVVSLNPFGFEYINGYETFSSGIALHARFGLGERFFISPLAGFKYTYKHSDLILRIGVSAGLRF